MHNTDLLNLMLTRLDEPLARFARLEQYYDARQPLAYMAPEQCQIMGRRFTHMATNIPRLAVTALAERLRVTGLRHDGRHIPRLWADWVRNDLDQLAGVAHREALTLGECPVIVWADRAGNPLVTVESAQQVAVERDPATRETIAAIKRWTTRTTTEATLFEPDKITLLRANNPNATTVGFEVVDTLPNPFGVVPVVMLRNSDRLLGPGASEIDDLIPLVDALNKQLADLMVTSESLARPRRWASGITPDEDEQGNPVNPFPETDRMMLTEQADARFGQLPGADLAAYEASVRVLLGQIMAVSALPAHYVGVFTDNPASADALRAAEASLTARAEARQLMFGRAWEQVARLMVAVRTGEDPRGVDVSIRWADASTRSIAQEADAIVKLVQAGILPTTKALEKLGYTADEISEITKELPTQQPLATTSQKEI